MKSILEEIGSTRARAGTARGGESGGLLRLPRIPQSLQRHVRADLVSEFEAVCHDLGDGVNFQRDASDAIFFYAFAERFVGQSNCLDPDSLHAGRALIARQGDPDFRRCFGRQFMKPEG